MTPEEKAVELVEKYRTIIRKSDVYDHLSYRFVYLSKQCVIIAVDEILKTFPNINGIAVYKDHVVDIEYWQQVKTEIENL